MMSRREKRVDISLESSISDGNKMFNGLVSNVSRNGIKLVDIPKKLDTAPSYLTVVSGKGKNFKFYVSPCWQSEGSHYKEMGFKIISPSLKWISFLKDLEYTVQ